MNLQTSAMANVKQYVVHEVRVISSQCIRSYPCADMIKPYLHLNCGLGEAPFWEKSTNRLRFVDIVKQELHFVDLDKGASSHTAKGLDISIGTTADIQDDDQHFIFGGKHGFGKMHRQTLEYTMIRKYWDGEPGQEDKERAFRGNDGAVDARGRYWSTIMRDPLVNEPTNDGVFCKTF